MNSHRQRLALLLALAWGLFGCPPRRLDFGVHGELRDPSELLARVSQEESKIFLLSGEAKLRVNSPGGKGAVSIFVALMHPALLHLEALDFFGRPRAVLVSNGETFDLYQAEEGQYFRGPATPRNIGRIAPVALAPAELVAIMLGRAPRIPPQTADLTLDPEKLAYRVVLKAGPVTQTLWVDPARLRVTQSEIRGVSAYDLRFADFQKADQATYPRQLVLSAPGEETTIEVSYKDVSVNGQPDLTLFELEPPPGVAVTEVDGLGNPRQERSTPDAGESGGSP